MDRVGSLRWRLRAFWYGIRALLPFGRHPSIVSMRAYRKGARPGGEAPSARPHRAGPPVDEIGVAVSARTALASQPRLFIAVTDCVAYSNGFTLGVAIRSKDHIDGRQLGFGPMHETGSDSGLQVAVRFGDGGDGPEIVMANGGGGGNTWNFNYFVWPLPPDGPVTITCKWPARGLKTAGKELNGTAIRAAGLKSKSVWN